MATGTLTLTQAANAALQYLSVLDSGGSASTQQLDDALVIGNELIDSKSADRLFADTVTLVTQALVSGTQSYAITRVANIEAASIILSTGTNPLQIVNAVEWQRIVDRDSTSHQVRKLFYNRTFTTGTIYLSPIPLSGSVQYTAWAAMSQFVDKTTTLTMHPAYSRWLKLQLALELAPQYAGAQITKEFLQNLADAAATLRNLNASLLGLDPPSGQVAANAQGVVIPGVDKGGG